MAGMPLSIRFKADGTAEVVSAARAVSGGIDTVSNATSNAAKSTENLTRQSQGAAQMLNSLKAAALGVVGALSARQVGQYADAWADITSRLRLVSKDSKELATAQGELYRIANDTRVALESTSELYTRLARASKELGKTQRELFAVTETVNQTLAISGGSAESAKAALIQFNQALASGVLRGEEFNSVMEQAPRLAQALADELADGSTGALRKMAEAGEISAKRIVVAMQNQAPQIQKEFERMAITMSKAWQIVDNALMYHIGRLDQAAGASATLAAGIVGLAQNMGTFVDVATVAGSVLAAVYLRKGVLAAVAGLKSFYAVNLTAQQGMNGLTGALIRQTTAQRAAILATNTLRGSLAALGGPVGLGLTILTAGLTALSLQSSVAERAQTAHSTAMRASQDVFAKTGQSVDELRAKYQKLNEEGRKTTITDLESALRKQQAAIEANAKAMKDALFTMGNSMAAGGGLRVDQVLPKELGSGYRAFLNEIQAALTSKDGGAIGKLRTDIAELAKTVSDPMVAKAMRAFVDATGEFTEANRNTGAEVDRLQAALAVLTGTANDAQIALLNMSSGADEAAKQTGIAVGEYRKLSQKLEETRDQFSMTKTEILAVELAQKGASEQQRAYALAVSAQVGALEQYEQALKDNDKAKMASARASVMAAAEAEAAASRAIAFGAVWQAQQELVKNGILEIAQASALAAMAGEAAYQESLNRTTATLNAVLGRIDRDTKPGAGKKEKRDTLGEIDAEIEKHKALVLALRQGAAAAEAEAASLAARDAVLKANAKGDSVLAEAIRKKTLAQEAWKRVEESTRQNVDLAEELRILEAEKSLINASNQEREKTLDLLKAQIDHEKRLAVVKADPEAKKALEAEYEAKKRLLEQRAEMNAYLEQAKADAQEWRRIWEHAAEGIQDSLTGMFRDALDGNIKNFSDFGKSLLNVFKDIAAQIAAMLVFRPVVNGVVNAMGLGGAEGSGLTQAMGAAGSSGSSGILGSLLNMSGGTLASNLSTGGMLAGLGGFSGISQALSLGAIGSSMLTYGVGNTLAGGIAPAGLSTFIDVAGFASSHLGDWAASAVLDGAFFSPFGAIGSIGANLLGLGGGIGGSLGGIIGGFAGGAAGGALGGTAIGAALGSAAGPIGAIAGSFLGTALGGLFGKKKKKKKYPWAQATLGGEGGNWSVVDVDADDGGPKDKISETGADIATALNSIITGLRGEEVEALTDKIVLFKARTAEVELSTQEAADATRSYVEGLLGLRDVKPAATELEQAVIVLREKFAAMAPLLAEVGIAASMANVGLEKAITQLRDTFDTQISDSILALTNPMEAAIKQLDAQFDVIRRNAIAVGGDMVAVEKLYGLQRSEIMAQYAGQVISEHGKLWDDAEARLVDIFSSLTSWIGSLKYSDYSTLSSVEKYDSALNEMRAVGGAAAAGDISSIEKWQGYAQTYLEQARERYGSTQAYQDAFNEVMSFAEKISEQSPDELVANAVNEGSKVIVKTLEEQIGDLKSEIVELRKQVKISSLTPARVA